MCCILKEQKIMHFHYMTSGHALAQEPLPQGVMTLAIMIDPIFIIITIFLACPIHAQK